MKKIFVSMLALVCSLSLMATQTAYVQIKLVGTAYPSFSTSKLNLMEDTERNATYESGYDSQSAATLSNNYSVLLYGFVGSDKCSTVATNDLSGLQIGFTTNNVDTDYKLKFSDFEGTEFYLYDRVLNKLTLINSTTPDYAFTATAGQVEVNDRFVINTVAIIGTDSWWETKFNSIMTVATTGETATGTIDFTGHQGEWYNFKVVGRTAANWYSNAGEFTSTNNSQVVSATEDDNMYFQIVEEGEYTFTWTFATNNLEITFPTPAPAYETSVTTNAYGWATFSYSQNLVPVDADAQTIYKGSISGDALNLTAVAYVKAGEGVIVNGAPSTTYYFAVGNGAADFEGNALKATSTYNTSMKNVYVLKGNAFLEYVGTNALAANKAYIQLPEAGQNNAPARIRMVINGTQGVENVETEAVKAEKFIENGQVLIRRGNEVYNLQGQIVK